MTQGWIEPSGYRGRAPLWHENRHCPAIGDNADLQGPVPKASDIKECHVCWPGYARGDGRSKGASSAGLPGLGKRR